MTKIFITTIKCKYWKNIFVFILRLMHSTIAMRTFMMILKVVEMYQVKFKMNYIYEQSSFLKLGTLNLWISLSLSFLATTLHLLFITITSTYWNINEYSFLINGTCLVLGWEYYQPQVSWMLMQLKMPRIQTTNLQPFHWESVRICVKCSNFGPPIVTMRPVDQG